jgi:hypothetical protein
MKTNKAAAVLNIDTMQSLLAGSAENMGEGCVT